MTKILPPMSREEWESLPPEVKRFISWEDARQGKIIDIPQKDTNEAVKYFTR